ncbi:hypothetical protein GCM10010245_27160 [Streptomyces spectabilis]|uniref:DNA-directed RNA polymerase specialized sigma24 family protein n=1 Tax=Streptomyces spectabilis TaxID=68270 RepID=A0A5P2X8R7_STRST|nr:hypothetical protein [Streptomyces spectabilis]MBB5102949.1 hypothetical protein [Streptomyces spectabilis]MCI3902149.1 hypothetical protein [Streptomyces spectabilis]QEV59535.1 hypothetical protein CP982_12975 [Streptomyces spectabilis]GGV15708.1 hypothetical protein GCM10010245_27160 [Streptomyces spectabilis]
MSSSQSTKAAAPTGGAGETGSGRSVVDVEQAEAALVEHYPRLVRLAYLVLPPGLGRNRRVLTAHALVQRALPRGRTQTAVVPDQRGPGRGADPGYAYVRRQVLRAALEAGLPLRRRAWPKRSQLPPLLPQVWGLRLFPRSGGADELALDQRLSALSGPARAAYVLRGLERLGDDEVRRALDAAGVADADSALTEADGVEALYALLESPEFDPCSLQARPTDLMRRRQHLRAAAVAAAAALVCGALLGMPGDGWGPDGAAAPPYAKNPAAEAALDPAKLTRVAPTAWKRSPRTDFTAWPARGELSGDTALLRRALAVWARPGASVRVSATPGTAAGAPPGPAQLLFAGEVDAAHVVLLYDGLRVVRYAEPKDGTSGAALDFARVDGATAAESGAVVLGRSDGNVRYLTAPWVRSAAVRDLLRPTGSATGLRRGADGATAPFASPAVAGDCRSWNALQLRGADGATRLSTDLGELIPARLTAGRPAAPRDARAADWERTACSLAAARSHGVRSVNAWGYARQDLPDGSGRARWVCTRAETWRGGGSQALAQVVTPGAPAGAVAAKAENSPACGEREPRVLAGVLWKARTGSWYVLAAGSENVASVAVSGRDRVPGNLAALPAKQGERLQLTGRLTDGAKLNVLH